MKRRILALLKDSNLQAELKQLTPLTGGANNRVFKVDLHKQPSLVCKEYFQHPSDQRPRLFAEFSFLTYAWNLGIRCIPQPIYQSDKEGLALYTFVAGNTLPEEEINSSIIEQVINFFLTLNQQKELGASLPYASERCFSIQDFVQTVERKLGVLLTTPQETSLENELHQFLKQNLIPKWDGIKKTLNQDTWSEIIPEEDVCITPSDFGFHNALMTASHELIFLDFEYAGRDDPTKTVCDFFCQPKVPVPMKYYEQVKQAFVSITSTPEQYLSRTDQMMPVCQIKWCCIILNIFQNTGKNRRAFSDPQHLEKQEEQLNLAKRYLEHGIH